jgi:rRNA-processing protein FCF1
LKSKSNLIILDSNFILLPFQFKIDYFNEIRLTIEGKLRFIVFQQILNELESKRKREPEATKFARFLDAGIKYLEKNTNLYDIKFSDIIKESKESTDDFLIRMSQECKIVGHKIYLATNDSELRRKAKKLNIGTIFLRQKKYLSIERA